MWNVSTCQDSGDSITFSNSMMKTLQGACLNTKKCWGPQHWCQKTHLSFPHLVFQTAANGSHMFQTWIDVSSLIQSYSRAEAGLQLWNLWTSSKPWPKGPDSTMALQTACHSHKAAGGHKSWGKKTCHQCCIIFFYFGHRPFRNASVWTPSLPAGDRTALTCWSSTLSLCSRSLSQQSASGTSQVKHGKTT